MSDPIVGIDLGTSNTVVAYAEETGAVKVLGDEQGYKIHPSVVSFHPSGGVVVGAAAKQRKVIDPKNTIYSIKRLIGRTFNSPEVQTAKTRMPFQIKEGPNQQPLVVTRGGEFAVPEISAIVLDHVRNVAATQLQTSVNRAVVTVPASFNDAQRSATATAGAISGLTIVRVLNEPTAAALAYGNTRNLKEVIAVYDFGGGTFDITILKLEDQIYEVLGTSGDTFLGGDDLDERLVDRMVEKFLAEHRVDLRTNEVSMMRLRAVAEQTKIELSRRSRAVVRVDEIAYGANGRPLDLQIEITRDEFVRQVADIIDRTFPVVRESMTLAGLSNDNIDDVILVGGTTKIPYVRDQVSKFFARAPRTDISPEDAVAIGASLQATSLERILKRRSPSRASSVVEVPDEFSAAESTVTRADADDDDNSSTMPRADFPTDFARADQPEEEELLLVPPEDPIRAAKKRSTAGYDERRSPPDVDRAPTRGQHHDRFEERTPVPTPPAAAPIGRLTKANVTPPKSVPPSTPRTNPMPATRPPALASQSPTLMMEPPPRPQQAKTLIGEPAPREPTFEPSYVQPSSVEPPRSQHAFEPPTAVEPPPRPHQARTLIGEPARPPVPSTTARGFGVAPSESSAFRQHDDAPRSRRYRCAAASTAKGFAPPQTYPIAAGPVVLDVTPRGLGIGTVAGYCEELIRRNSRVPAEIRKLFTTSRDGQDSVRIIVCQGESRRLETNVIIGDLTLDGLPSRPRGETSIEVTFMLDASGILQVRARDAQTGREQRASLDLVGAMPQAEIAASRERMQALRR